MRYLLYAFTALYALLSVFAAGVQLKTAAKKDTAIVMVCGGVLLLCALLLRLAARPGSWLAAALGGGLIGTAAFCNGRRGNAFHLSHHLVRLALTILLAVGYLCLP